MQQLIILILIIIAIVYVVKSGKQKHLIMLDLAKIFGILSLIYLVIILKEKSRFVDNIPFGYLLGAILGTSILPLIFIILYFLMKHNAHKNNENSNKKS